VDNFGDTYSGTTGPGNTASLRAQNFDTGTASGTIGQIILGLSFTGGATSANVYLYSVNSSGAPLTDIGQIGTVSSTLNHLTGDEYSVAINSIFAAANPLSSSQNYAIVINNTGTTGVEWDYTALNSANTGVGSFGYAWNYNGGKWLDSGSSSQMRYMEVTVLPEPIARAEMIFGAVIAALIGLGRWRHHRINSKKKLVSYCITGNQITNI
jgi:hypothetical protein